MRRLTPLAVLLAFLLVGCPQQKQQKLARYGTHPSCEQPSQDTLTPPVVEISLKDDSIQLNPDPVRQLPGVGFVGWRSDTVDWKVSFVGKSPLRNAGPYQGKKGGGVVGSVVRKDAECTTYKYKVTVPDPGGGAPLTIDPETDIIPY